MNKLVVPKSLKRGDTIALISISGGRAGDELSKGIGLRDLQCIYGQL